MTNSAPEVALEVTPDVLTAAQEIIQEVRADNGLVDLPQTGTKRSRAFEMFVSQNMSLTQIAKAVGCSHQYLYKLADTEKWADRKMQMAVALTLGDDPIVAKAVEQATMQLHARLGQRILELDEICSNRKGLVSHRLKAILAWVQMAGVGKGMWEGLGDGAKRVEVHNDLSDRRQVTVVQGTQQEEDHDDLDGSTDALVHVPPPEAG